MAVSKPAKFGLILLVIVLLVILGVLADLIILPVEMITTTTTVAIVPTTTTTVKETTTTTTTTVAIVPTTTVPIMINKSYCEDNKCWLYEGKSLEVMKENITYRIGLVGVLDEDTAVIYVDGEIDTFDQGEDKIVKGLGIYLMEVFYLPKKEQLSFVQFLFY